MKKTLIVLIVVLLSGCASTYKPIRPEHLNYISTDNGDSLSFSYKYNVLFESRNKKYAKYETKKNIKLVAIRVTNNTGNKINLYNDAIFSIGEKQLLPVTPSVVIDLLKQGTAGYLLYALLLPAKLFTTNSSGVQHEVFPIGIILAPGLSIGNLITAGSANRSFRNEIYEYDLNQIIESGQTSYFLVGFMDIGFDPLTLKLKEK